MACTTVRERTSTGIATPWRAVATLTLHSGHTEWGWCRPAVSHCPGLTDPHPSQCHQCNLTREQRAASASGHGAWGPTLRGISSMHPASCQCPHPSSSCTPGPSQRLLLTGLLCPSCAPSLLPVLGKRPNRHRLRPPSDVSTGSAQAMPFVFAGSALPRGGEGGRDSHGTLLLLPGRAVLGHRIMELFGLK